MNKLRLLVWFCLGVLVGRGFSFAYHSFYWIIIGVLSYFVFVFIK